MNEPISLAFDVIRRYAEQQRWIPIGYREFHVGPWSITVNGTRDERDAVPPYHARITNDTYIGLMLVSPFGGKVAGFHGTEDAFIRDMEAELAAPQERER